MLNTLFIAITRAILMSKKAKFKGRHFLDVSKRYRAKTWYYAVKGRNPDLSDYQLGLVIANTVNSTQGTSPRVFDTIRRNGALPSRIGSLHVKRDFDLVEVIEKMPGYEGTIRVMDSPFWEIVDKPDIPVERLRSIVIDCTKLLNLNSNKNISDSDPNDQVMNNAWMQKFAQDNPNLPISEFFEHETMMMNWYDNELNNLFHHAFVADYRIFDYIAMLCALGLEANKANNSKIAKYNIDCAQSLLNYLGLQSWIKPIIKKLEKLLHVRMLRILRKDSLTGISSYQSMLKDLPGNTPESPITNFLNKHERLLWGN